MSPTPQPGGHGCQGSRHRFPVVLRACLLSPMSRERAHTHAHTQICPGTQQTPPRPLVPASLNEHVGVLLSVLLLSGKRTVGSGAAALASPMRWGPAPGARVCSGQGLPSSLGLSPSQGLPRLMSRGVSASGWGWGVAGLHHERTASTTCWNPASCLKTSFREVSVHL